ncbi:hypothetical protein [Stygiolobus caldivivus]|uniref:Uncharacterized protein n=1 Tax=Stygiolobus caldivivus TaxID=2824673 RepID=A0A8D5U4P9_9CREN|nr:hypothetical protein [Stygiolobus caldivivus]BCU69007.1 hypothetical protein KN1_03040 [Stygiolobus caldivivus]
MSDVIDNSSSYINDYTQTFDEDLRIGEALSHILAAASIVEEIEGETDDIKETVRRYVDAWIASLVPINYSPGMAEVIGSKINRKLTKIFPDVTEDDLGETLEMVIEAKREVNNGNLPPNYKEVEVRIEKILRILGVDLSVLNKFLEGDIITQQSRLISAFAIAIAIASVWDPKWIADYQ